MSGVQATEQSIEEPKFDLLSKIVLLGDSNTGKTSLIQRFMTGQFTQTVPTTHTDVIRREREIDGLRCEVQFWDPQIVGATDEQIETYLQDASGFIFVYDLNDRSSFKSTRSWFERISKDKDTSELTLALLGNKCDIEDKYVTPEAGRKMANDLRMNYFSQASAKSGDNVEEAFNTIMTLCKRKQFEVMAKKPRKKGCCTII